MADVNQIKDDIVDAVRDALDRAGDDAGSIARTARKAVGKATHRFVDVAEDFADEASARGRKAYKYASKEVTDHPIATAAILTGVAAAVLGLALLSRRR